jgi:hypothetical protein
VANPSLSDNLLSGVYHQLGGLVLDSGESQRDGELIFWKVSGGSRGPRLVLSFALVEGRAECVRVEIGAEFLPGEERTKLGAKFATVPRLRPLDTSTLRGVKLHSEIKKARKQWVRELEALAKGSLHGSKVASGIQREARSRLPVAQEAAKYDRPGPPHLGRGHFEKVALVYRDAHRSGDSPTAAVAEHFRVAYSTAARWVSRARHEYGLLPTTRRGKARSVARSRK